MSFSKGETVVYGGSGVCEIDDIKDVRFYHERPQKYYILKPLFVNQAQVVYVPFNNEKLTAKIKPVILRRKLLISFTALMTTMWSGSRTEMHVRNYLTVFLAAVTVRISLIL